MKSLPKILLFIAWLCVIVSVAYSYRASGVTLEEFPMHIRTWVDSFGIWGPLVYITLYTLRALTFFSATVFTIASGVIFGPELGVLYTFIGANFAANLAFFVGRYFGKDVIARAGEQVSFFPRGEKFRKNGFMTSLLMRLLFFPFDWVGYLSGAYNIRHRDFALGTFIGIIPGMIAFVALGGVAEDPVKGLSIFLPFFLIGLIIARVLKKTQLGRELEDVKTKGV